MGFFLFFSDCICRKILKHWSWIVSTICFDSEHFLNTCSLIIHSFDNERNLHITFLFNTFFFIYLLLFYLIYLFIVNYLFHPFMMWCWEDIVINGLYILGRYRENKTFWSRRFWKILARGEAECKIFSWNVENRDQKVLFPVESKKYFRVCFLLFDIIRY